MSRVFNSYIPKFLVSNPNVNDDIITVTTKYFSPDGDVYELDTRTIAPILIQTTQSLQELQPEISNVYPFKIVTPLDFDGATILQSPGATTTPTASQGYYAPIYFERYNLDVVQNINKNFNDSVRILPESVVLSVSELSPKNLNLTAVVKDPFDNTITTQQNLTWNSSDPAVVTVTSNGYLSAVSVGTATITVIYDTNIINQITVTVLK